MSASHTNVPEPSEIAGRFEIVQKLGAGAFGTVYKARDRVLGRLTAIKTIRMEGLAASQAGLGEMLDRFRREAQVAAQLKHPGIVTIYDIGEAQGLSYISMELIDGVGLDRVISESGRIPVERAATLSAQVADALDFAHRHGVVHRDIKPANIMIEAGDRVKVTDFGIAKPTDSAEHLTLTGSLLGTPSYMSPEQARGSLLDGRSDLFSLGCVIYEMVTGRKAFRGDSITALLFKIITEEPQPLRELDPTLPERLVEIIARAIAKAPETRYQSGRELADDLLTLAKPGSLPTLRSQEAATLPLASPGEPTTAIPATDRATRPPTRDAAAPAPPPLPAGPPPLPTAATRPVTAAPRRPAVAAPRPAAARKAPTAANRGAALLVLGLVGLLVVGGLGFGAWFFLSRRPPATAVATVTSPAAELPGTPSEGSAEATSPLPESAALEATPPTSAASAAPTPRSLVAAAHPPDAAPESAPPLTASSAPASPSAPTQDFSFLDEVPPETPDGRTAGEDLARKYRAGGSEGIGGRRFNRRSRFPARIALPERAAVGTLAHLLSAQEAYQRANGGYGTLPELSRAGLLHLDVPFGDDGFQRARYRFRLTAAGDEFRATATPLAPGPRPFLVDQSGYVRVDD